MKAGVSRVFGCVILLMAAGVQAAVVPGRWEKLNSQPTGTQLLVRFHSGEEMHCVFKGTTAEGLTVQDPVSGVLEFPKKSIARITSWDRRDDGNANGLLIGAGLGILLGALTAGEVDAAGGNGPASIVSSAGLGGLIGYLVDKAHRQPEILYSAPRR